MQSDSQQQIYQFNTQRQISDAYKQIQDQVRRKFKQLTTDTLQQLKNRMKSKQNKISQQENKNLITQQRQKIINEMQIHRGQCMHSGCRQVNEIQLVYGFVRGEELKDLVTYLCRLEIKGLGYKNTECYYGMMLNDRMTQTHRLMKGL